MYNFDEIKEMCDGLMREETYELLYNHAKESSVNGNIVEIGAWKGASTVCLGLGTKDSLKNNGMVYSIDKSKTSKNNIPRVLEKYNLNDHVKFFNEDAESSVISDIVPVDNISMILIDAISPELLLNNFYDRIIDDGWIIFDDYNNIISKRGREFLKSCLLSNKKHKFIHNHTVKSFKEYGYNKAHPLGKHYTIFRIVNYLMDNNIIYPEFRKYSTLFCKKPKGAIYKYSDHENNILRIKENILDDFYRIIAYSYMDLVKLNKYEGKEV